MIYQISFSLTKIKRNTVLVYLEKVEQKRLKKEKGHTVPTKVV